MYREYQRGAYKKFSGSIGTRMHVRTHARIRLYKVWYRKIILVEKDFIISNFYDDKSNIAN